MGKDCRQMLPFSIYFGRSIEGPLKRKRPAADAKEVGMGNPAEGNVPPPSWE
jgi:hypothetical protein